MQLRQPGPAVQLRQPGCPAPPVGPGGGQVSLAGLVRLWENRLWQGLFWQDLGQPVQIAIATAGLPCPGTGGPGPRKVAAHRPRPGLHRQTIAFRQRMRGQQGGAGIHLGVIARLQMLMGGGGDQIGIRRVGGDDVAQGQGGGPGPPVAQAGLAEQQACGGRVCRQPAGIRDRRRPQAAILEMRRQKAAVRRDALEQHAPVIGQIIIADALEPALRIGGGIGVAPVLPAGGRRHAQMIQIKAGALHRQSGAVVIPFAMQGGVGCLLRDGRRKQPDLRLATPDPVHPVGIGAIHFAQLKAPQGLHAGAGHRGDLVLQPGLEPLVRIDGQYPGRPHGPGGGQQTVAPGWLVALRHGGLPVIPTDPGMHQRRKVRQQRRHQHRIMAIGKHRDDHRLGGVRTPEKTGLQRHKRTDQKGLGVTIWPSGQMTRVQGAG